MGDAFVFVLVGLAYLLTFGISYALFRRVRNGDGTDDSVPSTQGGKSDLTRYSSIRSASASATSTVVCPLCGTENERTYDYCRNCVADLSAPGHRRPRGNRR